MTAKVSIGVQVYAQPELLALTLDSIRTHTSPRVELLLLPDGPDVQTARALATLHHLTQLSTTDARGAAACFNRLVGARHADVFVLLESGSIVGPDWLDHLLAALDADPSHGLAGPSTNRSWNEQGVFPRAGGTPAEIARSAQLAARRFGITARTLEPLHSLADFCYMVKREVVETIGAADEGYGLGPCWEMDYNIRAARAGLKGVWACAAYVYRAPFTERRRREEAVRFDASKRRYQDKFCALRLRGDKAGYEPHCRGDACEHFAPPDGIQIHLPLSDAPAIPFVQIPPEIPKDKASSEAIALPSVPGRTLGLSHSHPPRPSSPVVHHSSPIHSSAPLVSCVMPTGNRTDYVLQSIHYLQQQDYANWELIILDDGDDNLASRLPADPRIRHQPVRHGLSIGAKRNQGCALAQGEIIAQWDDDDWYGPARLSAQIAPLVAHTANITGLQDTIFFDLDRWAFWRCTPELHRRLFVEDVHGGTLVFWRETWQRSGGYPDRSLAEDAVFLRQVTRSGARLARLPGQDHFVYLRHGNNSWSFVCGQYLDPRGWQRIDDSPLPGEALAFYAARSSCAPSDRYEISFTQASGTQPLVSCIMPTADRRAFVGQAIQYFMRQEYPNRELIVIDDGADAVADLIPGNTAIRYVRLSTRHSVGAKRNLACEEARGDIIVHFDDDDWSAPRRLSYQVNGLLHEEADICGLSRVFYYDPWKHQAWQYVYPEHAKAWVGGNTLCYQKTFWRRNPFPNVNVGEDTRFVWADSARHVIALSDPSFFVATIHPRNVSPKRPAGSRWHPVTVREVEVLLGEDLQFYAKLTL